LPSSMWRSGFRDAFPYLLPWGEGGARPRSGWEVEGVRRIEIILDRP
jgi:hypothetical protein